MNLKIKYFLLCLFISSNYLANEQIYADFLNKSFYNKQYQKSDDLSKSKIHDLTKAEILSIPGTKVYDNVENQNSVEKKYFNRSTRADYKAALSLRHKADIAYIKVDKAYNAYTKANQIYLKSVPHQYHIEAHKAYLTSLDAHEKYLNENKPEFAKLRMKALNLLALYNRLDAEAVAIDDVADDVFNNLE